MSKSKYFTTSEHGEIKVTLGLNDDQNSEVRCSFNLEEIGDVSVAIELKAIEDDIASDLFERLDEEAARQAVLVGTEQVRQLRELLGNTHQIPTKQAVDFNELDDDHDDEVFIEQEQWK